MRGQNQKGFSVLEALLVTALMGLFLVIASDLASALRSATSTADEVEKHNRRQLELVGQLENDLKAALEVANPGIGVTSNTASLRLYKRSVLVPAAANARLPLPPSGRFVIWNPVADDYMTQRDYSVKSDFFGYSDDGGDHQPLDKVKSFSIQRNDGELYELRFDFEGETRDRTLVARVVRP